MNPLCLRISGFLSYLEPAEINFTDFEIACISGANGAGKSSLLDAITWALFGQARRRDDALIHSRANLAKVIFDFEYEGNRYQVQRSKQRDKTTTLEFLIQNNQGELRPLTEHSLRETEERIQSTLRLDYETFTNSAFFLQGRADQFTQQRPAERKRILSSILGLDIWEQYRQTTAEHRKSIESDLARIEGQLAEVNNELSEAPQRQARLQQARATLQEISVQRHEQAKILDFARQQNSLLEEHRRHLRVLSEQLQTTQQRCQLLQHQMQERELKRQALLETLQTAETVQAQYRAWQEATQALKKYDALAEKYRSQEKRRKAPEMQIATERARLQQEQKTLLDHQRQIAQRQTKIRELDELITTTEQEAANLAEKLAQRTSLQDEMSQLQIQYGELIAEKERLHQAMKDIEQQIGTLQTAQGCCPTCNRPLDEQESQALIKTLQATGQEMGDQYRANRTIIGMNAQRQREIQQQIKELQSIETRHQQASKRLDALLFSRQNLSQEIQAWQEQEAPRLEELTHRLQAEDFALPARAELASIDLELRALGYDPSEHQAARLAEETGRKSQDALLNLEKARAALEPLEGEISRQREQITSLSSEQKKLEEAFYQDEQRIQAVESPNLDDIEAAFYRLQEKENRQLAEVGAANQQVQVLESLHTRQSELQRNRAECTTQIGRLKTLEQAFGKDGIPALLIEQALPEIEDQANQLLDRLSDGNMSVRFVTQRDYKDKTRDDKRETLDILISDPTGWREYELFSGGEAFRVNFAIRLALSRVLAQRAGARLQLLVIDEGFGSQDADGIQRLIEAIHQVRNDFARILVITHLEGMKDAFPTRIEVEKIPTGSQVRVITL